MFKQTFKLLGLLLLLVLSFVYTNKVFGVVKKNDPIMKKVMAYKKIHDLKAKEPLVNNDDIILGCAGKIVDNDESYRNMKSEGKFDEDKIIYKTIFPKTSILKNYDYYITKGNSKSMKVAVVIKVNDGDNLDLLLNQAKESNLKLTFFLDGKWLIDNVNKAYKIFENGFEIESLGFNNEYQKNFLGTKRLFNSITNEPLKYCLNETKDNASKKYCANKKLHSIYPSLINPSIDEIRKNISSGAIISFDLKDYDKTNFMLMMRSITSRGLDIDYLRVIASE